MFRGLVISVGLHVGVIAASMATWPVQKSDCEIKIEKLRAENPEMSMLEMVVRYPECAGTLSLPIEIVDISAVTDIAPTIKADRPDETEEQQLEQNPEDAEVDPALDENETEEEAPPEDSKAETDEEEVVVPDDEDQKENDPKDEADEPEDEKEQPLIEKQEEKIDNPLAFLKDFDETLLNKEDERKRAPPPELDPITKPVLRDVERAQRGAGKRKGNTASLQAAMRRQIEYCWRGVDDLPEPDRLHVTVQMNLDRDGNLSGNAKLIKPSRVPVGDRPMQQATERALRAVRKCAPYKMPADDYESWQEITVNIGPDG